MTSPKGGARPTGRAVSKEWLGDWDGERMSEPHCAHHCVPHGETESGGIVLAVICWATSAQEEGTIQQKEDLLSGVIKAKSGNRRRGTL
jgi:hypothetical protein